VPAYLINKSGVRSLTGNYLLISETLLLTGDGFRETEELFK